MSAHDYTEDRLVEQPAIRLFAEVGWPVAGPSSTAGVSGEPRDAGLLGRETKGEVVLVPRLRAALEKLNPAQPDSATALWELYRRGFGSHHIFAVDEFYWEDRPRYYAALEAVRRQGEDLTS